MKKQAYERINNVIKNNKALFFFIKALYTILPIIVVMCYIATIVYLIITKDNRIIRVIVVPAGVFLAVTIMRILINEPRPYEAMDINPLFPKNTNGKSFPSRHVASAFIISLAALYINIPFGIVLMFIATIIAILRPIVGVHYIKDVVWGCVISLIMGILFIFIL